MPSILIVDDDPDHLEFVATVVGRAGYSAYKAQDSAQCVVLADVVAPDLLVINLAMPGLDSVVLTTRTRARGNRTPIIGMTDGGPGLTPESQRAFLAAGATRLIAKPFSGGELLRLVDDLIGVGFHGSGFASAAE